MVDLYLIIDNGFSAKLLSIPNDDIDHLSVRPLKWFRFTMFCICGARGHIVTGVDGAVVDYDSTSLQ